LRQRVDVEEQDGPDGDDDEVLSEEQQEEQ